MTEHSIIFSTEMIRAILDGRYILHSLYFEGEELDNKKNADHPIEQFAQLWDSLNLKRGDEGSIALWVLEFKRTERK